MFKRAFQIVVTITLCILLLTCKVYAFTLLEETSAIPDVEPIAFGVHHVDVFELDMPELPEPMIKVRTYSLEELDLLARLITAEAGSDWLPDEVQLYVGSVVLNRMASDWYPDTLEGVIYQSGQYSPTWTGAIYNTPSQRTIENAKYLLTYGSVLPANVVYQANFTQGDGIYYQYYDSVLGTTSYFCYRN